jgi:hypothetical protein
VHKIETFPGLIAGQYKSVSAHLFGHPPSGAHPRLVFAEFGDPKGVACGPARTK